MINTYHVKAHVLLKLIKRLLDDRVQEGTLQLTHGDLLVIFVVYVEAQQRVSDATDDVRELAARLVVELAGGQARRGGQEELLVADNLNLHGDRSSQKSTQTFCHRGDGGVLRFQQTCGHFRFDRILLVDVFIAGVVTLFSKIKSIDEQ